MQSASIQISADARLTSDTALRNVVVMWDDGPQSSLTALQHGLQKALVDCGIEAVHRQSSSVTRQLARLAARLKLVRPVLPRAGRQSITVLSWASEARAFPDSYWRELVPWIFDCWEPDFPRWEALLARHRIRTAFFSSRAAVQHFSSRMPKLRAEWIPEACDPAVYRAGKKLVDRSIGVLEPGRRWEFVHQQITEPLARAGIRHLYNGNDVGARLFANTNQLYAGFSDAMVMLCFPKFLTHPQEAGCIETFTQRYLEAIGSGCIPVGHAPQELVDLFGFNPVVELSLSDPAEHLLEILAEPARYQEMTIVSLKRLHEVGTFTERAKRIVQVLGDRW